MNEDLSLTEIKAWLRSPRGMSRTELAARLFVSKRTLDNWLCEQSQIPAGKRRAIFDLIHPSESPVLLFKDARSVSCVISAEDYGLIAQAALSSGKTLDEWLSEAVAEKLKRK